MTAFQTGVVVEHAFVDLFSDSGACCTPGSAAEQCTEDSTSPAAEDRADWSGDHAERRASFGTAKRCGGTPGSTGDGTDRTTGFAGVVARGDA
ncbi:hypothetical protein LV28_25335 [Pandoraea pnomenusa]|nr:hypothetical protein LV28_25335 [Pandoraea pnomenusa]